MLPDDVSEMPKNWNRRFKHNRDKIKTGDIYELAEVVRNLAFRETEKGLSTGEKQMFTRAKKILASELMYALEMDEDERRDPLDDLLARVGRGQRQGAGRGQVSVDCGHRGRRTWRTPWRRPAQGVRHAGREADAGVVGGRAARRSWTTWSSRCRRARSRPLGRSAPRAASTARSRCATRWRRRREGDPVVVHDAARPLITAELVREASRRWATTTPRSRRRRWRTRSRRPTRRRRGAHADRARGCGPCRRRRCSAARRSSGRSACPTTCWPRRPTTPGSSSGSAARVEIVRFPAGNIKVTTPLDLEIAERCCAVLTDYHVHLRPDDRGPRRRRAALHRRERRPLPDGGHRARDRGARRLRAHLPLLRRAGRLGAPVLAPQARRRPRRLLRVRARRDRPAARHRGRLRAGARGPHGELLDAREWDYVVGSVHFLREGAVDHDDYDVWDSAPRPRPGLAALLRDGWARRRARGMFDILAHPDLVKMWGRRGPGPRATCAATTTWPWSGSPRPASRSRCRPPGCASRWARSTRRGRSWRWCSTPATRSRCPPTPTRPTTSAPATSRRVELLGDHGVDRDRRVRGARAADGADRMSARTGIGYDSHRLAEGRRLVLGGVEIAHDRGLDGPLRRRRPHPRRHRRAARRRRPGRHRPALPRHRRALRATPTRSTCCARSSGLLGDGGLTVVHVDATVLAEAPEARAPPRRHARRRWPMRSASRRRGQRQGHERRGHGLRRPRGGDRGAGRGDGRGRGRLERERPVDDRLAVDAARQRAEGAVAVCAQAAGAERVGDGGRRVAQQERRPAGPARGPRRAPRLPLRGSGQRQRRQRPVGSTLEVRVVARVGAGARARARPAAPAAPRGCGAIARSTSSATTLPEPSQTVLIWMSR